MTPVRPSSLPRRAAGFSLVELMVAVLIGLVGVLIMSNVLLSSDQRNRTTTSGNEALSNGAVVQHMLQRDLMQAGYGLNAPALLGCTMVLPNGVTVPVAPVTINPPTTLLPAGDNGSDTLLVVYGSSDFQPQGNAIFSTSGSDYTMQSAASFRAAVSGRPADRVLAAPDKGINDPCAAALTLAQVTAVSGNIVTVSTASSTATALFNLGPNPRVIGYAVRNGALTSCDYMANDCTSATPADVALRWPALAPNVPVLRAVYGRDTNAAGSMNGDVEVWDQTAPAANACGWARTLGVRTVLVARSAAYESQLNTTTGQRECEPVTTNAAPAWQGAASAPINLALTNTNWQCYRHRTFESVAPLRNVIWMGNQAGC